MTFVWPRGEVRLDGDRLILASRERGQLSDASGIDGCWMRFAETEPSESAILALANAYGLLRAPNELISTWVALINGLSELGRPWTYPFVETKPREVDIMMAPAVGEAALVHTAQAHARLLRQHALRSGDVAIEAGDLNFEPVPRNLAGYLVVTANNDLNASPQPRFKRCAYCHGWYSRGRADQRFCMPKHRYAFSKEEREREEL
jgi:hypothetical protein